MWIPLKNTENTENTANTGCGYKFLEEYKDKRNELQCISVFFPHKFSVLFEVPNHISDENQLKLNFFENLQLYLTPSPQMWKKSQVSADLLRSRPNLQLIRCQHF